MMCPFCARAISLLKKKGVAYDEIDVTFSNKKRQQMTDLADGRYTVPQIFIDGNGIGGCDELIELERNGELDPLLAGA
jgi:glutaredoxin 3